MPRFSSSGQKTVRIWWDSQVQAYRMQSPYDPGFVEFLKTAVAAPQRSYDPANKIWTFTEAFLDPVVKLCKTVWPTQPPQVITRQQVEAAQAPPSGQSAAAISHKQASPLIAEFFELVPYEGMRKAYLEAIKLHHPDRGGDMEKATKLNAVWTALEKEFYLVK